MFLKLMFQTFALPWHERETAVTARIYSLTSGSVLPSGFDGPQSHVGGFHSKGDIGL